MAVIPTMMVLYTNDAVDVRYSDGSLLQLSPCGSSMFHHDSLSDIPRHPLAAMQGVQKWTQFVTSAHKDKVLQAVDFRNRFASRPFLCSTLMAPEDIVSLYAKIDKISWEKMVDKSHIEILEDGSRRVVSLDEYASLILSPHGQDFTVCYLSGISQDMIDSSTIHQSQCSSYVHGANFGITPLATTSLQAEINTEGCGGHKQTHKDLIEFDNDPRVSHDVVQKTDSTEVAFDRNCNNSTPVNEIPVSEEVVNSSGLILSEGTISTPGRTAQQDDLHTSAFSVQHEISSISRVSTPDGLRGLVECDGMLTLNDDTDIPSADVLHSSPLSLANTHYASENDSYRNTFGNAVKKNPQKTDCNEKCAVVENCSPGTGSPTQQQVTTIKPAIGEKHSGPSLFTENTNGRGTHTCTQKADQSPPLRQEPRPHSYTVPCSTLNSENKVQQVSGKERQYVGGVSAHRSESRSASRHHYTWLTQHISCDNCPPAWRHPLRLLQQMDPTDSVLVSECNMTVATNVAKGLQKSGAADASKYVLSSLVSPLPLSCPLQHLHQWHSHQDQEDQATDSISDFKHGQLKVIMMEGVVYRFLDVANMKIVEIYPGDGSVFVSQGITASFFSHLHWKDGKLEEKTYSVNLLPPNQPMARLIKRGHRLLTGCIHNSKVSQREDLPCWKHVPIQVVEPLSTSLLEECSVPGCGQFKAYSNGRIRVVFDDRTALDMMADFSQRLRGCLQHSSVGDIEEKLSGEEKLAAVKLTSFDVQLQSAQCRLLLPSGKYIMVEVHKPGLYRRYVEAAKEWIHWVQSSPKERCHFYQNKATSHTARLSAEAELKKIHCFNYIVDHTTVTSGPVGFTDSSSSQQSATGLQASSVPNSQARSLIPPASAHWNSMRCRAVPHHTDSLSGRTGAEGTKIFNSSNGFFSSDPKQQDLLQGFNSVKEALLRTSQMIKDIDDIVKDKKEIGSHSHPGMPD